MNKKIVIIVLCILLTISFVTSGKYIKNNQNSSNDKPYLELGVDVPIWSIGNNWKYDMMFNGDFGETLSFNWIFENTLFTVVSESDTIYSIEIEGDVTGEINIFEIQLISGSLKETTVTGTTKFEKSNIGIKEINAQIAGKIAFAGIPLKSFTMDIDVTFSPSYNAVYFPLDVGKKWTVSISDMIGFIDISLLSNPVLIDDIVGGDYCECTGIETITVPVGTYDAYKVISDEDVSERYYSPEVGNFIKACGDSGNKIDIVLISTNYGSTPGAPNKPSRPQGVTTGTPGNSYTYSSSTTDNENDQIYYLFDWSDGTNSGWIGPYLSGEECCATKTWNNRGSYAVKVKAKDVNEYESEWSDPLNVIMPKNKNIITSLIQITLLKYNNNNNINNIIITNNK